MPLFAAIGGIAAAASAIFWATHRSAPIPLVTTRLEPPTQRAASTNTRVDDTGPVGVNIDSLPIAAVPTVPDGQTMSNVLAGRRPPAAAAQQGAAPTAASRPVKDLGRDPTEVDNPYKSKDTASTATPPTPPATTVATPPTSVALATTAPPAAAIVPPDQRAPLNRGAALAALGSAASAATGCKRDGGPTGSGSASVTFSPDGPVKSVTVSAPFAGTPVGQCVASVFRGAHVPPFSGSSVTLPKSFQIPQ